MTKSLNIKIKIFIRLSKTKIAKFDESNSLYIKPPPNLEQILSFLINNPCSYSYNLKNLIVEYDNLCETKGNIL